MTYALAPVTRIVVSSPIMLAVVPQASIIPRRAEPRESEEGLMCSQFRVSYIVSGISTSPLVGGML